jgi:hypothetical protein
MPRWRISKSFIGAHRRSLAVMQRDNYISVEWYLSPSWGFRRHIGLLSAPEEVFGE